jgi:hypothetical protein
MCIARQIYRWRADPAFVAAMEAAWEVDYYGWQYEVYEPQKAARKTERERRNADLLPVHCKITTRTLEARRRKRGY